MGWKEWKAKHWGERTEGAFIESGWISVGKTTAPPLRMAARWIAANGWRISALVVGAVAAVAAIMDALR